MVLLASIVTVFAADKCIDGFAEQVVLWLVLLHRKLYASMFFDFDRFCEVVILIKQTCKYIARQVVEARCPQGYGPDNARGLCAIVQNSPK